MCELGTCDSLGWTTLRDVYVREETRNANEIGYKERNQIELAVELFMTYKWEPWGRHGVLYNAYRVSKYASMVYCY